jgi:hypothetical protein
VIVEKGEEYTRNLILKGSRKTKTRNRTDDNFFIE